MSPVIGAPFSITSLLSWGREMTLRRNSAKCLLMVCNKAGKPAAMQYLFLPKPVCPMIHDQSDQCSSQNAKCNDLFKQLFGSHIGNRAAPPKMAGKKQIEL